MIKYIIQETAFGIDIFKYDYENNLKTILFTTDENKQVYNNLKTKSSHINIHAKFDTFEDAVNFVKNEEFIKKISERSLKSQLSIIKDYQNQIIKIIQDIKENTVPKMKMMKKKLRQLE